MKTGLVLQTPLLGAFTATITNPVGLQVILSNTQLNNTNWNAYESVIGVASLFIDLAVSKRYNFSVSFKIKRNIFFSFQDSGLIP